jgi:hypothetical protein
MRCSLYPRLSEAIEFLPRLRRELAVGAAHPPPRVGLAVELVPICEEGLFGYEVAPDRETHTYIIVGRNTGGEATLRRTVYGARPRNGLQLAAVDGYVVAQRACRPLPGILTRDVGFDDWAPAVEAAWCQLLFPGGLRRPALVREQANGCLDEALSVAYSYLAAWDPFIMFCGLPSEAEQGFRLFGAHAGEHGELIFQRPDIWVLRWKTPPRAVYESWSITLPDTDACGDAAGRGRQA